MRNLALIAALLFAPMPAMAETITGVSSVIDGDTLEVRGQRIRLHGIDAPESRQICIRADGTSLRCGQQAALALSDRIGRQQVSCRVRDTDRYGRAIAVCVQDGSDLNEWMVQQGWAVAYRRYSRDYIPAEEDARRSRRNIWSGQFDMPWNWRRAQRGG
ncbi:thermonuclease family protein [uncultured Boseongicola sp.]|jgi:endonuclease YncB( thermonuclease family)|uniref:thermonuclease family protein n=1 Tax=uncultured Boseongicola sp. TaxID=1648499 RepID=UPI00262248E3|nr:thermonuclease family protein [uncultured Boseongicola sp.]